MISHRHTKGKVLDLNSEVCPNSYLDNTKVAQGVEVYVSKLHRCWVETSDVNRCWGIASRVEGSTLTLSTINRSDIADSKIYDSSVENSKIYGANLRGATIINSKIIDAWIGNATVSNVTIEGDIRIGTGYWTRSPRFFTINTADIKNVVVTESTNGWAYIGCTRKPMRTWIKGAERFRKVIGWDTETKDLVVSHFEEWLKDIYA